MYYIKDVDDRDVAALGSEGIDWRPADMDGNDIEISSKEEYDRAMEILGRKKSAN